MQKSIALIAGLLAFSVLISGFFLVTHNVPTGTGYTPATPIEEIPEYELKSVQAKARGGDQEAAARLFDYYAFGEGTGKQDSDKQADYWQFQLAENGRITAQDFFVDQYYGLRLVNRNEAKRQLGVALAKGWHGAREKLAMIEAEEKRR